MSKVAHKPEGYRYVRQYRTKSGSRWALWAKVDGKAKRVGTATTEYDRDQHLNGPERTLTYAGETVTVEAVQATIKLLRYYRQFLASECTHARIPGDQFKDTMDKAEARRRLSKMIHVAINRKAGVPQSRKWSYEYQIGVYRDQQRLRDIGSRVRVYQFETADMRRRFGHLLACHDD